MAWYILAGIGIAAALVFALVAPDLARKAVGVTNQFMSAIVVVVGAAIAFYWLTSGITLYVIIGVVSVVVGFWRWDPLEIL